MLERTNAIDALNLWCKIITRGVRETAYDLSPRQTVILLHVYLTEPPHTIKNLSEKLNISKAAACRAVDVLCTYNLLKRKRDEGDKRNVIIHRTVAGSVYLSDMADIIRDETSELVEEA